MKQMKLGAKIFLGFALLILIAVALGGMAVYEMNAVKTESIKLSDEYVPEVHVASEVERFGLEAMFEMRGYALSEDRKYLDAGKGKLAEVKQALKEAQELAAKSPHLVKLKDQVQVARKAVEEYEGFVEQTVARNQTIAALRKQLDESAKSYMDGTEQYLKSQNEAMSQHIKADAEAAVLADRLLKITLINDVIDLGNATRVANYKAQTLGDAQLMREALKSFDGIDKKLNEIRSATKQEVNLKQLDQIKAAAANYKQGMTDYLSTWQILKELTTSREKASGNVLVAARETAQAGIEQTLNISKDNSSLLGQASWIMLIGLAVALVVGILLAFLITRSITKPINRTIEALTMGADQVASASGQVSSASQQLAEGASEQAAAVEETSSSLEEMTSMTQQNADNADQAKKLVEESRNMVNRGSGSMQQMKQAMQEISTSGQEISKIIKSIDEIAFQTNLLALNAAVEAARAGEAGQGFAVVADEVRSLAQRAAESARNTSELIEGTINRINLGNELVGKVSEAFDDVRGSSNKVSELVDEIAAASREQAQGIDQINNAVAQMDKVTQQNAANAEESASASEELSAQAESMKDVVLGLQAMVGGHNGHLAPMQRAYIPERPRQQLTTRRETALAPARKTAPRQKIVRPDDVIPMDDDFKDF